METPVAPEAKKAMIVPPPGPINPCLRATSDLALALTAKSRADVAQEVTLLISELTEA